MPEEKDIVEIDVALASNDKLDFMPDYPKHKGMLLAFLAQHGQSTQIDEADELMRSVGADESRVYNPNPKLSRDQVYTIQYKRQALKVKLSNSLQLTPEQPNHFTILPHGRKSRLAEKVDAAVIGEGISGKVKGAGKLLELDEDTFKLTDQAKIVKHQKLTRDKGEDQQSWEARVRKKLAAVKKEDELTRAVHPDCEQTVVRHFVKEGIETVSFETAMPNYGEDLDTLIEAQEIKEKSENSVLRFCRDVFKALEQVHAAGIVHRDIKLDNILRDDSGKIRVIDFGESRRADEPDTEAVGAIDFLSPEELQHGRSSDKSDVYAMCLVLVKCLTGKAYHPFADKLPDGKSVSNTKFTVDDIKRYLSSKKVSELLAETLYDYIQRGLSENPEERPSAKAFYELFDALKKNLPNLHLDIITQQTTEKTKAFFEHNLDQNKPIGQNLDELFRKVLSEYQGGNSKHRIVSLFFSGKYHHHIDAVSSALGKKTPDLYQEVIKELTSAGKELNPEGTLAEILKVFAACKGTELNISELNADIRRAATPPAPSV